MRQFPLIVRRTVAIGLLTALVGALWLFVAAPIANALIENEAEIEKERVLQGRLRAALAEQPISQEPGDGALGKLFLSGDSEAITVANLQSLLTGYATQSGVRVRSTRSLPPRDKPDLHLIGVQMVFSSSIESFQRLVHQIESATPSLVVDQLAINALAQRYTSNNGSTDAAPMEVRLDVYGAVLRAKE